MASVFVCTPEHLMSPNHIRLWLLQVFLEYVDSAACANAKSMLGGRKFGGNTVAADYYPEDKYYSADYSG